MPETIAFTVNERSVSVESDPERSLLDVLREDLNLHGTKYGCGEGQCGACTVLIEGKRAFACKTAVGDVKGKKLLTIEGVAREGKLHPVQVAFLAEQAFQCGYCTAGMIMSTVALLAEKPRPSEAEIVTWMNRHVCRCGTYASIVKAVRRAAGETEGVTK